MPHAGNVLHVNTEQVDDTAGATWAVAATLTTGCEGCLPAGSVLRFNVPINPGGPPHALAGDFTVTSGRLRVDKSFTTTGRLTHSSGSISVDSTGSCVFDES